MDASIRRFGKRETCKFFKDIEKIDLQKLFGQWTKYSMATFEIGCFAGDKDFVAYHFKVGMDWNTGKWKIRSMDTVYVPCREVA